MTRIFVEATLQGRRFSEHRIPVELLSELDVYRKFVVELAKHLWTAENPARHRLPKGFSRSFDLSLSSIESGSAVARLVRSEPEQGQIPESDYFDQARELLEEAIQSANDDGELPDRFPAESLLFFQQLGRKLDDDDAIAFSVPGTSSPPVRYDQSTRKRLLRKKLQTYQRPASVVAKLTGANKRTESFEVGMLDGKLLTPSLSAEYKSEVLESMRYEDRYLLLSGVAEFHLDDSIKEFVEVEEVSILDEEMSLAIASIDVRLTELVTLKPGWLDGKGAAPAQDSIDWCRRHLPLIVDRLGWVGPRIYPMPEGGVQIEWGNDDVDVTLVVEAARNAVHLEIVDFENPTEDESFDLGLGREDVLALLEPLTRNERFSLGEA